MRGTHSLGCFRIFVESLELCLSAKVNACMRNVSMQAFIFVSLCSCSIRCFELFKETHVVFGEHAEILYLVFQVGNAFYAHAEGVT